MGKITPFKAPLYVLMIIHIAQSLASIIFVFGISNNKYSSLFCLFVGALVPFFAYGYILAETVILQKCDSLLRTWMITDMIILVLTTLSFCYRSAVLFKKRN